MRICIFTNTFLPHVGGVALSVRTFLEDFKRAGNRVMVVAPEFAEGRAPGRIESCVARVPAWRNFNGSDFSVSFPLGPETMERIERFRPEIVHAQHPFLLGDSALRVAAQFDLPVVFTHHTLYEQYTHYLPFDSDAVQAFVIELATRFANCCQGVIAPSESVARLLGERGVDVPVKVIPTGVDSASFSSASRSRWRRRLELPDEAVVVGHVGRLAEEKNLDHLSEAMARCLSRVGMAHALIVGDGPARKRVEETFAERGVRDRAHFIGRQTGQPWRDAYAAMDLFAFSSQSETQGMVMAEAMAAGVPVVALDASGVRDVVRDGSNGRLLAADASAESMARVLTNAARRAELRERWREGALETAARLDRRVSAGKALDFYQELLAKRPAREAVDDWEGWWRETSDRLAIEGRLIGDKVAAIAHAVFDGISVRFGAPSRC